MVVSGTLSKLHFVIILIQLESDVARQKHPAAVLTVIDPIPPLSPNGGGGADTEKLQIGAHADVVKVVSAPSVVPFALVAVARKWYVVPHERPLRTPPPMATGTLPEPSG